MDRDGKTSTVPYALMVFLWGSVAAWLHFGLAVGGYEVGVVHEDHKALETFAELVGGKVDAHQKPVEISLDDSHSDAPPVPTEPPPAPTEKPKVNPPPPVASAKPVQPKKVVPKPQAEKKVVALVKPEPSAKVAPPPPLHSDKRIAVRQHVKPDQADNSKAHFIADQANHVDKETVATLTSHDRDDENPTPSGVHSNPDQNPGDSNQTKIAEADAHKGDDRRAPGERGTEFDIQHDPPPDRPMGPVAMIAPPSQATPRSGGDGKPRGSEQQVQPPPDLAPGNTAPPSPDLQSADNGSWTFNIARTPGEGDRQRTGPGSASRKLPPPVAGRRTYGLGGRAQPGQVNLNLNNHGVVAVVGKDELRREREADGARRKSEHRGSWQASNFQRWRSAIENYVTSVKPGNQTALNTAAVPFATYLNSMHNRIHPIFADSFLLSLDSLPPGNPLNDQHLITRLEIVLSRDGHLVRMGVVKTSGVTAFDIAALDSVERASPFGPAPSAIISPDGRVYLHWEFHRDEIYACSTMNARPFILKVAPGPLPGQNPSPVTPTPAGNPRERGAPPPGMNDTREGLLLVRPAHDG